MGAGAKMKRETAISAMVGCALAAMFNAGKFLQTREDKWLFGAVAGLFFIWVIGKVMRRE